MSLKSASLPCIVVQLLSLVQLFAIPWTAACQTSLSFIISLSLLKLMSIKAMMPPNHLILCHLLLLLPSVLPSIRVFFSESALCIRWPKNWNFSIGPSNQGWSPLGLFGLISLLSKGLSRVFSNTTIQKHQFVGQHVDDEKLTKKTHNVRAVSLAFLGAKWGLQPGRQHFG